MGSVCANPSTGLRGSKKRRGEPAATYAVYVGRMTPSRSKSRGPELHGRQGGQARRVDQYEPAQALAAHESLTRQRGDGRRAGLAGRPGQRGEVLLRERQLEPDRPARPRAFGYLRELEERPGAPRLDGGPAEGLELALHGQRPVREAAGQPDVE